MSVADCKKRWKNIKDTYDRKKREKTPTGSDAEPEKKRKKWQLAEKLSFLQSTDNHRKCMSNIQISYSEEKINENISVEETRSVDEPVDDPQPTGFVDPDKESISVDATPFPPQNSIPETSANLVKKQTRSTPKTQRSRKGNRDKFASFLERRDKERNQIFKKLVGEEEDDVDLFFKSIAKSVKRLRPDLITQAKLQTLSVVANLESQMWSQCADHSLNSHLATNVSFSSPSTPGSMCSATSTHVASPPDTSSVERNAGNMPSCNADEGESFVQLFQQMQPTNF